MIIEKSRGQEKEIAINDTRGNTYLYKGKTKKGRIIAGYTADNELTFYGRNNNDFRANISKTLDALNIKSEYLRVPVVHKDQILFNTDDGESDAIISEEKTIVLAPADCIGLLSYNTKTGHLAITHAGREGMGLRIIEKVADKMKNIEENHWKHILPPHIHCYSYPHPTDDFMRGTWWEKHPEFVRKKGEIFYPDLESAFLFQLEKVLPKSDLKLAGLDTAKIPGASFKHNSKRQAHARNLFFIGYKQDEK